MTPQRQPSDNKTRLGGIEIGPEGKKNRLERDGQRKTGSERLISERE